MTTESGSDSESKPEQEAEPQEAAGAQGAQGHAAGAQPGPGPEPEPSGEDQQQALEQFEAAAHSTPVRKEVSEPRGCPLPHTPEPHPQNQSGNVDSPFQGLGPPWSLSTAGNYGGSLVSPFWSQADGKFLLF